MAIPIKRLLDLSEDDKALRLIEAREKQMKDKQAEIMTKNREWPRQEGQNPARGSARNCLKAYREWSRHNYYF